MRWPAAKAAGARQERWLVDPVELWKRFAEVNVKREQRAQQRTAGVKLSIEPWFLLAMLLLGLPFGPLGPAEMAVLVLSVLLAQELPRALFARALGRSAKVAISLRGTDTEASGTPLHAATALVFAAIGSLANLAVAGAAAVGARQTSGTGLSSLLLAAASMHAAWGLAQALPMLPFRAGAAITLRLGASWRFAHAAASLVLALLALMTPAAGIRALVPLPLALLAALGALSATAATYGESLDKQHGIPDAAEKARALLLVGDPETASNLAAEAFQKARSPRQRAELCKTIAWAAIGRHEPFGAHAALGRLPPEAFDVHLVASYLDCCNRVDEAVRLLERARELGHRSVETTRLLVDLYFRRGDLRAVRSLASADREFMPAGDLQTVESALLGAGGRLQTGF